jgi:hypothetical protein
MPDKKDNALSSALERGQTAMDTFQEELRRNAYETGQAAGKAQRQGDVARVNFHRDYLRKIKGLADNPREIDDLFSKGYKGEDYPSPL